MGDLPEAGESRILGLDVGHRRIGVAVSDPSGTLATPLPPIQGRQRSNALQVLAERCRVAGIREVVVGLPYTLRGEIGPQAQTTLKFVAALRRTVPVPVRTWDESFSTETARELLRAQGVPSAQWPQRLDSAAAAVMLQSYLDTRSGPGRPA